MIESVKLIEDIKEAKNSMKSMDKIEESKANEYAEGEESESKEAKKSEKFIDKIEEVKANDYMMSLDKIEDPEAKYLKDKKAENQYDSEVEKSKDKNETIEVSEGHEAKKSEESIDVKEMVESTKSEVMNSSEEKTVVEKSENKGMKVDSGLGLVKENTTNNNIVIVNETDSDAVITALQTPPESSSVASASASTFASSSLKELNVMNVTNASSTDVHCGAICSPISVKDLKSITGIRSNVITSFDIQVDTAADNDMVAEIDNHDLTKVSVDISPRGGPSRVVSAGTRDRHQGLISTKFLITDIEQSESEKVVNNHEYNLEHTDRVVKCERTIVTSSKTGLNDSWKSIFNRNRIESAKNLSKNGLILEENRTVSKNTLETLPNKKKLLKTKNTPVKLSIKKQIINNGSARKSKSDSNKKKERKKQEKGKEKGELEKIFDNIRKKRMIFENVKESEKIEVEKKKANEKIELEETETELPKLSRFEEIRIKFETDKEEKRNEEKRKKVTRQAEAELGQAQQKLS